MQNVSMTIHGVAKIVVGDVEHRGGTGDCPRYTFLRCIVTTKDGEEVKLDLFAEGDELMVNPI